jgi:hypothetical protein
MNLLQKANISTVLIKGGFAQFLLQFAASYRLFPTVGIYIGADKCNSSPALKNSLQMLLLFTEQIKTLWLWRFRNHNHCRANQTTM